MTDLTVRDVAHELRLHPDTVRSLITTGDLRAYRTRGDRGPYRIAPDSIDEYREQQKNRDPWARSRPRRTGASR